MKRLFFTKAFALSVIICSANILISAQSPCIKKQRTLGGSGDDSPGNNILEVQGGFIVCGSTNSGNGTFNVPSGNDADAYIAKLNSNGNVMWEHTYGGTGVDGFITASKTTDGGLIAIGYTSSNDGDVSGNHGGDEDVWVVKMNAGGNLQWQKCYGGSSDDFAISIVQTPFGYAFCGSTASSDGDITSTHGGYDIWLVKILLNGTILQQKTYGGSGDDLNPNLFRNQDGSYIICGETYGNDGDLTGNHGTSGIDDDLKDMFAMKVNAFGTIIWTHLIGGSHGDNMNGATRTNDGNIVLGSLTNSNDGDVTDNHGGNDAWLVKINAQNGNFIWKKCYGDALDQGAYGGVTATADGGVLAVGITGNFNIGYNTDDVLVFKVDCNGNQEWQTIFGGSDEDDGFAGLESSSGKIFVSSFIFSSDGDVHNNHGNSDSWFVKLGECGNLREAADESKIADEQFTNETMIFPNPFSTSTAITFSLPQSQNVSLKVFDVNGRLIKTLADNIFEEGEHQIEFNAEKLNAGIYFLQFQTGETLQTEKLIITK